MKETVDLVTDGRLELTPSAAAVLADMIAIWRRVTTTKS